LVNPESTAPAFPRQEARLDEPWTPVPQLGRRRIRLPALPVGRQGFELDPLKAEELGDLIENPGHLRFFILCGDGQTD